MAGVKLTESEVALILEGTFVSEGFGVTKVKGGGYLELRVCIVLGIPIEVEKEKTKKRKSLRGEDANEQSLPG